MMTLDERVEKLLKDIYDESFKRAMEGMYIDLTDFIRNALIDQDKITRHACAEAVMLCEVDGVLLIKSRIHGVVMNCGGGVE